LSREKCAGISYSSNAIEKFNLAEIKSVVCYNNISSNDSNGLRRRKKVKANYLIKMYTQTNTNLRIWQYDELVNVHV
jgi:hypothetical protein